MSRSSRESKDTSVPSRITPSASSVMLLMGTASPRMGFFPMKTPEKSCAASAFFAAGRKASRGSTSRREGSPSGMAKPGAGAGASSSSGGALSCIRAAAWISSSVGG